MGLQGIQLPSNIEKVNESHLVFQAVRSLDGMRKPFAEPYIIFFPQISRDGMKFPVNSFIREQSPRHDEESTCWRGDLVVAKYRDQEFSAMVDASIADFPLIRNHFINHSMY